MVVPFLGQIMSEEEATAVSKEFTERCYQEIREKPKEELEDNEGEDLCNAEFSLAYGAARPPALGQPVGSPPTALTTVVLATEMPESPAQHGFWLA